jgi:hypothetical protein
MLLVEEAHDCSLSGAVSAATVDPIVIIITAFAATPLTPASVDPATITAAAVAAAAFIATDPFTSDTVASFTDVTPPPTAECMVCNMVTLPQPMWYCNICTRSTCYECVQEHACVDACGCSDLTMVRHPHEELFVKLHKHGLVRPASGPLKSIAEVCEGMVEVNMMLREPSSTCAASIFAGKRSSSASSPRSLGYLRKPAPGRLEAIPEDCEEGMLQASEEAILLNKASRPAPALNPAARRAFHLPSPAPMEPTSVSAFSIWGEALAESVMSRAAITPSSTCATSFVAGKSSQSASRVGSPKSCTSRKLSFN